MIDVDESELFLWPKVRRRGYHAVAFDNKIESWLEEEITRDAATVLELVKNYGHRHRKYSEK